jgi:hypothetical protein
MKHALALCVVLILAGCHSVESYEMTNTAPMRGEGGARRVEDGIEIWVQGAPDKEYRQLKYTEITTTGTIGVQAYLFRQLKAQTRAIGGHGFILVDKQRHPIGAIGTTAGYTTTAALAQENTYRAIIFRYTTPASGSR